MVEVETPVKFGGVTEAPRKASPFLVSISEIPTEIGYSEEAIEEVMKAEGVLIEKRWPSDLGQA